jgi:hypothetical protein
VAAAKFDVLIFPSAVSNFFKADTQNTRSSGELRHTSAVEEISLNCRKRPEESAGVHILFGLYAIKSQLINVVGV